MPTMTRTRDGLTQTVSASDGQVTWYLAQGYTLDPSGIPPISVDRLIRLLEVVAGRLRVTYTDGTTDDLAAVGGSAGGFAFDTDGVPYLAEPGQPGTVGYERDTDGIPYLLSA